MRIIDVHNHFYPPAYLDVLRSGESVVTVTTDAHGNPEIHYPGDYNVAVPGHRDIAYRQTVLEKEQVDTQVLTLTTPGTHVESPANSANMARLAGALPENRRSHPHHRRPFLNGDLEVVTHAHGQLAFTFPKVSFRS